MGEIPQIRATCTPTPEVPCVIEQVRAHTAEMGVSIEIIDIVDEQRMLAREHDRKAVGRYGVTKEQCDVVITRGNGFRARDQHDIVLRAGGQGELPMGETCQQALRVGFDSAIELKFHGEKAVGEMSVDMEPSTR